MLKSLETIQYLRIYLIDMLKSLETHNTVIIKKLLQNQPTIIYSGSWVSEFSVRKRESPGDEGISQY